MISAINSIKILAEAASPEKKAEALEYGIHLEKGQTLVDSYQTGKTS